MKTRIELKLTKYDGKKVDLSHMSSDALDSFLNSIEIFKNLLLQSLGRSDISFSLKKGSATCNAESVTDDEVEKFDNDIDSVFLGTSDNDMFITGVRSLQRELKTSFDGYSLKIHSDGNRKTDIGSRLKTNKIPNRKKDFSIKPAIVSGVLQDVGGVRPNYHIAFNKIDKVTIKCASKAEALTVNPYLYKKITIATYFIHGSKETYQHVAYLSDDVKGIIMSFITEYNKENDIINKIDIIYDYCDRAFIQKIGFQFISFLLKVFANKRYNVNEIKTVLIITKGLQLDTDSKNLRINLLSIFQGMNTN